MGQILFSFLFQSFGGIGTQESIRTHILPMAIVIMHPPTSSVDLIGCRYTWDIPGLWLVDWLRVVTVGFSASQHKQHSGAHVLSTIGC